MIRVRQHLQEEDGIALITALLAVVILTGLVVVFLSRSIVETRASGNARDFETAVHAAEAGSDLVISELNRDETYATETAGGTTVEAPDSTADERDWTLGHLPDMRNSATWIARENGEAYAIRPVDSAGEPLDVIYAAGAIPSFGHDNARIRVLKLQVAQDDFTPDHALLSDSDVRMKGSAAFVMAGCDAAAPDPDKCIADVHTNQSFNAESETVVHGTVTSAGGSCTSSAPVVDCLGSDDGVAEQPIPPFSARDFYRPGEQASGVDWYDLCPDGTVKEGSGAGPCNGAQVWPSPDESGTRFRGWRHQTTGSWSGWVGNPVSSGVFYVHRSDARVNGSEGEGQQAVTVLVETDASKPGTTGTLEVGGFPRIRAALDDVLMITDRDFSMEGGEELSTDPADDCENRTETQFSGFIGVGEQAKMSGAAMLRGAMIVQDEEDLHSAVQRGLNDEFAGQMCLDFDPDMVIDMSGHWVITYWNEL